MTEEQVDYDRALEIAAERLADALRSASSSNTSHVAQLTDATAEISQALESGEDIPREQIEMAVAYTQWVRDDLIDVAELLGYSAWDAGLSWGEVSEEEREQIQDRECPTEP